jgi:hypothetical protein
VKVRRVPTSPQGWKDFSQRELHYETALLVLLYQICLAMSRSLS